MQVRAVRKGTFMLKRIYYAIIYSTFQDLAEFALTGLMVYCFLKGNTVWGFLWMGLLAIAILADIREYLEYLDYTDPEPEDTKDIAEPGGH